MVLSGRQWCPIMSNGVQWHSVVVLIVERWLMIAHCPTTVQSGANIMPIDSLLNSSANVANNVKLSQNY